MKLRSIITIFLFLMGVLMILYAKPLSRIYYSQYFFYIKKPQLEKSFLKIQPGINAYLSGMSEFGVQRKQGENNQYFCVHEIVGEKNFSKNKGTVFLFALCGNYHTHGEDVQKTDGYTLPVAITQHPQTHTKVFSHKTVTTQKYSEQIKEVFPWFISPHLYVYSPDQIHPMSKKLKMKADVYASSLTNY